MNFSLKFGYISRMTIILLVTLIISGSYIYFARALGTPHITQATDTGVSDSDGITNETRVDISGDCTPLYSVNLYIDGIQSNTIGCTPAGDYLFQSVALAEGEYDIHTTEEDGIGGPMSLPSSATTIVIDTTAPGDIIPTNYSSPEVTDTPIFTFICEDGATISVEIPETSDTLNGICANNIATLTPSMPIPSGTFTLYMGQVDLAGNQSTITTLSNSVSPGVLYPAPTISTIFGHPGTNHYPIFSGSCIDGTTVIASNTSSNETFSTVCSGGVYEFVTTNYIPDGVFSIVISQDNSSGDFATRTVSASIITPDPTFTNLPASTIATHHPVFMGTCVTGFTVNISISNTSELIEAPCLAGLFQAQAKTYIPNTNTDISLSQVDINSGNSTIPIVYNRDIFTIDPPVALSGQVQGNTLTLFYDQSIDPSRPPDVSQFIVLVDGNTVNINSLGITDKTIAFVLDTPVQVGSNVSISYDATPPEIRNIDGFLSIAFSNFPVTNITTEPQLVSSTVNGTFLQLTYSESMNSGKIPVPGQYVILVNGSPRTVNSVSVPGDTTVGLFLASPIYPGDTVSVAYTQPGSDVLESLFGIPVPMFSATAVTNISALPLPVTLAMAGNTMTITYDVELDTHIVPNISQYDIYINNSPAIISSVRISGKSVILKTIDVAIPGDTVELSYVATGNILRNVYQLPAPDISRQTIYNQSAVLMPSNAYIYSSILTLEYTSQVNGFNPSTSPDISQYTVRVNGTPVTLSGVVLTTDPNQRSLRIILAHPVDVGNTVSVDYVNAPIILKDTLGNSVGSFSNFSVQNRTSGVTMISSCATLGVSGQRYELTTDISAVGSCFQANVSVPNITLDCKGHKITGAGYGTAIVGPSYGGEGFTVQNCEMENFAMGIGLYYHTYDSNILYNTIHDLVGVGVGISFGQHLYRSAIIGNNIYNNSGIGINIAQHNNGMFLKSNYIDSSGPKGIFSESEGSMVSSNTSTNHSICNYDFVSVPYLFSGNTGGDYECKIDTVAPSSPLILSPTNGDTYTSVPTSIVATGEPGTIYRIKTSTGMVVATGTVSMEGNIIYPFVPTLTNGVYTYRIDLTDLSSNTSIDSPVTFTVGVVSPDTTPPSVPTVLTPTSGSTSNDATPTITGTGEIGAVFSIRDGSGNLLATGTVDSSGNFSTTLSANLPEGSNTLSITLADTAGNTSAATSLSLSIDTISPTTPTISPIPNPTSTGALTLTGTADSGSIISVRDGSGNTLCTTTATASNTYSCGPLSPAPIVSTTLTVSSCDTANNCPSISTALVIDTTPPSVPTVLTPTSGSTSNDATPTITGTGEIGAVFSIRDGSGNLLATGTVDSSGNFSTTLSANLPEGSNTLSITLADAAGNTSAVRILSLIVNSISQTYTGNGGVGPTPNPENIRSYSGLVTPVTIISNSPSSVSVHTVVDPITDYICPTVAQVYLPEELKARDIKKNSIYNDAIRNIIMYRGVISTEGGNPSIADIDSGIAKNSLYFRPNNEITRAEFVKMLARSLSCRYTDMGTSTSFSDVPTNMWYAQYIKYAVENGWINGYSDGTFKPNAPISRAEAAKILIRAIRLKSNTNTTESIFMDVPKNSEFAPYVYSLSSLDIFNTNNKKIFGIDRPLLRSEAAYIINKIFFTIEK